MGCCGCAPTTGFLPRQSSLNDSSTLSHRAESGRRRTTSPQGAVASTAHHKALLCRRHSGFVERLRPSLWSVVHCRLDQFVEIGDTTVSALDVFTPTSHKGSPHSHLFISQSLRHPAPPQSRSHHYEGWLPFYEAWRGGCGLFLSDYHQCTHDLLQTRCRQCGSESTRPERATFQMADRS